MHIILGLKCPIDIPRCSQGVRIARVLGVSQEESQRCGSAQWEASWISNQVATFLPNGDRPLAHDENQQNHNVPAGSIQPPQWGHAEPGKRHAESDGHKGQASILRLQAALCGVGHRETGLDRGLCVPRTGQLYGPSQRTQQTFANIYIEGRLSTPWGKAGRTISYISLLSRPEIHFWLLTCIPLSANRPTFLGRRFRHAYWLHVPVLYPSIPSATLLTSIPFLAGIL